MQDYKILTTEDIKNIFIDKYNKGEFRYLYNGEVKTVEIQHAHFLADKDYIIRKPNYDYAAREIQWYDSQSLNVEDIPGDTPKIWKDCADENGIINSNYGWVIYSPQNFLQYKNCLETLKKDLHSRQACMIYNRPSMQYECKFNGMHDFMCTFSTQVFVNEDENGNHFVDYIVYQRSCDAVFGYNNDINWHKIVLSRLCKDLSEQLKMEFKERNIIYNCSSIHVYERHFKFLTN